MQPGRVALGVSRFRRRLSSPRPRVMRYLRRYAGATRRRAAAAARAARPAAQPL
jgi:hypothetical protein